MIPLLFDKSVGSAILPARSENSHKGDFGRTFLLNGSEGYSGAAVMASRSAVKGGCGLVFSGVPESIYGIAASACPEAITFPLSSDAGGGFSLSILSDARFISYARSADSILTGCGVIPVPAAKKALAFFLSLDKPLIIDAGMLNFIKRGSDGLIRAEGCPPLNSRVILTPHAGEAARIYGGDFREGLGSEADYAARLAHISGATVILKSHRTVTASPDGRVYINTCGNSGMAKGGSGDVLAGLVAALSARIADSFSAAALAVYIHASAGDLAAVSLGKNGMTPLDIIDHLPQAMAELEVMRGDQFRR